jgi:hypothetical protein
VRHPSYTTPSTLRNPIPQAKALYLNSAYSYQITTMEHSENAQQHLDSEVAGAQSTDDAIAAFTGMSEFNPQEPPTSTSSAQEPPAEKLQQDNTSDNSAGGDREPGQSEQEPKSPKAPKPAEEPKQATTEQAAVITGDRDVSHFVRQESEITEQNEPSKSPQPHILELATPQLPEAAVQQHLAIPQAQGDTTGQGYVRPDLDERIKQEPSQDEGELLGPSMEPIQINKSEVQARENTSEEIRGDPYALAASFIKDKTPADEEQKDKSALDNQQTHPDEALRVGQDQDGRDEPHDDTPQELLPRNSASSAGPQQNAEYFPSWIGAHESSLESSSSTSQGSHLPSNVAARIEKEKELLSLTNSDDWHTSDEVNGGVDEYTKRGYAQFKSTAPAAGPSMNLHEYLNDEDKAFMDQISNLHRPPSGTEPRAKQESYVSDGSLHSGPQDFITSFYPPQRSGFESISPLPNALGRRSQGAPFDTQYQQAVQAQQLPQYALGFSAGPQLLQQSSRPHMYTAPNMSLAGSMPYAGAQSGYQLHPHQQLGIGNPSSGHLQQQHGQVVPYNIRSNIGPSAPTNGYTMPGQMPMSSYAGNYQTMMQPKTKHESHRRQVVVDENDCGSEDEEPLQTRSKRHPSTLSSLVLGTSPSPANSGQRSTVRHGDDESDIEFLESKRITKSSHATHKKAASLRRPLPKPTEDEPAPPSNDASDDAEINWKLPTFEAQFLPAASKEDPAIAKVSIPGLVREEIFLSPDHADQEMHLVLNLFMPGQKVLQFPDPAPAQALLNFHTIAGMVVEAFVQFEIGDEFGTGRGHWHNQHDQGEDEYERMREAQNADQDEIFFAVIDRWRAGMESGKKPLLLIRGVQEFCDIALDIIYYIKENGLLRATPKPRAASSDKGVKRGSRTKQEVAADEAAGKGKQKAGGPAAKVKQGSKRAAPIVNTVTPRKKAKTATPKTKAKTKSKGPQVMIVKKPSRSK